MTKKLSGKRFSTLLTLLRESRDADGYEDDFPQSLAEPDDLSKGIPTLARNVYRDSTPMLSTRFEIAGRWENAQVGFDWLGIKEMRAIWRDKEIRQRIEITGTYWDESPPNLYPLERLSLLGLDPEDAGEIYLIWPKTAKAEPRVWRSASQHCDEHKNLREYICWLLS